MAVRSAPPRDVHALSHGAEQTHRPLATVTIGAETVHLASQAEALHAICAAKRSAHPLAVASINLDHIHHFRAGMPTRSDSSVDWLNLIDGAPVAAQVRRMTGRRYPKLSGSDLVGPILDDAAHSGRRLAIVGGSPALASALAERIAADWPGLSYAGQWAPPREALASSSESLGIAVAIRRAEVDIVLVCLGKPRQEQWIAEYGHDTGAAVLLAFGAVVDFLAGRATRAPRWVSDAGIEWAWRLLLEPRRLAKRYLVEGPAAYVAVRRSSRTRSRA